MRRLRSAKRGSCSSLSKPTANEWRAKGAERTSQANETNSSMRVRRRWRDCWGPLAQPSTTDITSRRPSPLTFIRDPNRVRSPSGWVLLWHHLTATQNLVSSNITARRRGAGCSANFKLHNMDVHDPGGRHYFPTSPRGEFENQINRLLVK